MPLTPEQIEKATTVPREIHCGSCIHGTGSPCRKFHHMRDAADKCLGRFPDFEYRKWKPVNGPFIKDDDFNV